MKNRNKTWLRSLVALMLFGLGTAQAADFSTWAKKMEVQFTGYTPSETLTNFPALVVLNTGISGFNYIDFTSGTNDDLRFTAADGTTELNYEVESWDTNGSSYVWVQVPELANSASIWAYWSKSRETAPVCTTNGATWSNGFAGVWHMQAPNAPDATANLLNATAMGNASTTGIVGMGQNFDLGDYAYVTDLPNDSRLDVPYLTISLWMKAGAQTDPYCRPVDRSYLGAFCIARVSDGTTAGLWCKGTGPADSQVTVFDNVWHHVVYTFDGVISRAYVDGVARGTITPPTGVISAIDQDLRFGCGEPGSERYIGALDEVQLSAVPRSPAWIEAAYMNTASNGIFATQAAVINNFGLAGILTDPPTSVTETSANLNGYLSSLGGSACGIFVYYGPTDGGTNAANWANTNTTMVAPQSVGAKSVSVTVPAGGETFYCFAATNEAGLVWASASQYFMTTNVTVSVTPGSVGELNETATFSFVRPSTVTGGVVTVNFAVSGTAVSDVDYVPIAGTSIVIPAGATNATLTVTTIMDSVTDNGETVVITLLPGLYTTGASSAATLTISDTALVPGSVNATVAAGSWDSRTIWSAGYVPLVGQDVTVNHAVTLASAPPELLALRVADGGTLALSNWSSTLSATDVTIASNAVITCDGPFANAPAMSNRVAIVCSTLTIDAGGKIDVTGKGYQGGVPNYGSGSGPGGGYGSDPAGGGGHGGYGGRQNGNGHSFGGGMYDSAAMPLIPGSGGGDSYDHAGGTAGGGAVRIAATGCVTVNGSILADGVEDHPLGWVRKGTGSGGSVYITCDILVGVTGLISADGGAANTANAQGSGGGGRIAVSNDVAAQTLVPAPTVQFSANGGARTVSEASRGGIGSIYLSDARLIMDGLANVLNGRIESPQSFTNSSLTLNNRWLGFAAGVHAEVTGNVLVDGAYSKLELGGYELGVYGPFNRRFDVPGGSSLTVGGDLVVTNSAQLRVFAGLTADPETVPGSVVDVAGTLDLAPGARVYVYSHPTNGASPELRAGDLSMATNTVIGASLWGYAAAVGATGSAGAGHEWWGWGEGMGGGGGGAGYGGAGYGLGGVTYGDSDAPALPGSGGGSGNSNWGGGGNGGGLVHMVVDRQITLESGSVIRSDGGTHGDLTPNGDRVGGGGSGGGIYLQCVKFQSNANVTLSARGGDSARGGGGGGGGGRIAIWRVLDISAGAPTFNVAGGLGYSTGTLTPAADGLAGTVSWGLVPPAGTVIVIR